jgi:hypothetical protein
MDEVQDAMTRLGMRSAGAPASGKNADVVVKSKR